VSNFKIGLPFKNNVDDTDKCGIKSFIPIEASDNVATDMTSGDM